MYKKGKLNTGATVYFKRFYNTVEVLIIGMVCTATFYTMEEEGLLNVYNLLEEGSLEDSTAEVWDRVVRNMTLFH